MTHRDSAGRIRTDLMMSPQPLVDHAKPQINSLAEIDDPVAGYIYILDDFHKIAHRIVPCSWPAQLVPIAARLASEPETPPRLRGGDGTDLGTQTMSGVAVTGRRVTTMRAQETSEENWYSAEFGMNFLTKTIAPDQETTQTMTNFTAGEPNPALFHVPAGSKIVDETGAFTITIPSQGQ